MRHSVVLASALWLVGLSACRTYQNIPAGEVTAAQVGASGRWSAALAPPPALGGALAVSGWAAMVRDSSGLGTQVTLSLSDAPAASVHQWSVNRGRCGADEGVFGSAGVYQPIRADSAGRATASARVKLPLAAAGQYFVSVRARAPGGETTVACGNFAAPLK
ncbi:MAG TPA: hypothetical protein VF832_10045 [Longimicrobiales bacterium]